MSDCCCNPFGSASTPAGPVQPFIGRFFASPSFAGTSTGSSANPFKTIAAAFAAAAAQGLVSGIIYLSAETFTENVVFPPAGGSWSLQAIEEFGTFSTTLTGTVTLDNSATAGGGFTEFSLNDIDIENTVTGAYSGGAGTTCVFRLNNSFVDAAVTFTSTGGGRLVCEVLGEGLWGFEDGINGALSVQGQLWTDGTTIVGPVTFQGVSFAFNTRFDGRQFTSNGVAGLSLDNCQINGVTNFTAVAGSLNVIVDGTTAADLLRVGSTATGTVDFRTANANASARSVLNAALPPTSVTQQAPFGLYSATATLTVIASGAIGNLITVSVVFTNLIGVLTTLQVGPVLNANLAPGTEVQGTVAFSHNGASDIKIRVDGFTTVPTVSVGLAVQKLN